MTNPQHLRMSTHALRHDVADGTRAPHDSAGRPWESVPIAAGDAGPATGGLRLGGGAGESGAHWATRISVPPRPMSVAETDLDPTVLEELALKLVASRATMTGGDLAELLHLPLGEVTESIIAALRRDGLVEPVGGGTGLLGATGIILRASDRGVQQAHQISQRSGYAGPAPVSLASYVQGLREQLALRRFAGRERIWRYLAHLVLPDETRDQVGLAVKSGGPLFLHGNPGNGKTAIAAAVARVLGGGMVVPYAVEVDGQMMRVFDPSVHRPLPPDMMPNVRFDERWVLCQVPFVHAGGELRLDQLDLLWNERQRYYDCPLQMKAAGGVLFIDDFGRQTYPPAYVLNRWIVPLETGMDYLTLATGRQVAVPFTPLLIFATNLEPSDLGDAAFLRRLPCKIAVPDPTAEAFREIFQHTCAEAGLEFSEAAYTYLVERYYTRAGRSFSACHARDLLRLAQSAAGYFGVSAQLTPQMVEAAARLYFV
jgi:predicted ATPase with chaperone activity